MGLDILVVDDDLIIREVVSRHLRRLGHQVVLAGNGVEAIRVAATQRLDLVVTDLSMPEMDGHELLLRMRSEQPMVPIIIMTSHVNLDAIMSCLRRGAFSFVTKPLGDCAELDACIAQAAWMVGEWRRQLGKLQRLAKEAP